MPEEHKKEPYKRREMGFSLFTKLFIVLAIVGVGAAIYTVFPAAGETFIGITLRTQSDLERGLVGHWTFDGADLVQNVTDRSGQGNNGYLVNFTSTTTVSGRIGQALSLDADLSQYVSIPYSASLEVPDSGGSVTAWFKLKSELSQNVNRAIFRKQGHSNVNATHGYELLISRKAGAGAGPSALGACIGGESFCQNFEDDSQQTLELEDWYHGAFTWTDSVITLYLDGTFSTSTTRNNVLSYPSQMDAWIGRRLSTSFADIDVDDVRVYNRTLSPTEITRLYNLGATTKIAQTVNTQPDLERGLVGHWTFDGPEINWGSNTATDRSGGGNTGTITNMSTSSSPTSGRIGQALQFDEASDSVEISTNGISNTAGTVSVWVRAVSTSGTLQNYIFCHNSVASDSSCGNGSRIYMRGQDGELFIGLGATPNIDTNISFPNDEFIHFVMVYDNGTWIVYKNGDEATATNTYSTTLTIQASANIGSSRNGGANGFNGTIDDFRIYDRALSAEEVKRLHNLGR